MNNEHMVLPPIDQRTIECDLRKFTDWLNRMADQVNWVTSVYVELKEVVDKLVIKVKELEDKVEYLESKVAELETRVEVVEKDVEQLKQEIEALQKLIDMLNERLDMLYGWLPIPYGMIPSKGWKFAMGNINVMSSNGGVASVDGPGIFTSGGIENNDLYFN